MADPEKKRPAPSVRALLTGEDPAQPAPPPVRPQPSEITLTIGGKPRPPQPPDPTTFEAPEPGPLSRFATEATQGINPSNINDMVQQTFWHPVDTAGAMVSGHDAMWRQALDAFQQGDHATGVRLLSQWALPVATGAMGAGAGLLTGGPVGALVGGAGGYAGGVGLASRLGQAADYMKQGDYPSALGATTDVGLGITAPKILGAAATTLNAPVGRSRGRLVLSQRVPSAVGTDPALLGERPLIADLEAAKQDPGFLHKIAQEARRSHLIRPGEGRWNDEGVINAFVDRAAENIGGVVEATPSDVQEGSGKWYQGAHKLAKGIGQSVDLPTEVGSGAIAAESPSTTWPINIELAQRIPRWWRDLTQRNSVFEQEHFYNWADSKYKAAMQDMRSENLRGTRAQKYWNGLNAQFEDVKRYVGTRWENLPPEVKAIMLRSESEMSGEPQTYGLYSPEGDLLVPTAMTKEGQPAGLKWQSRENVADAIKILEDPSDANISKVLGGNKRRGFFNNTNVPWDPRFATVDVQHVAASHFLPLSGESPQVKAVVSGADSASTGIKGAYPLYDAAVKQSAKNARRVPNAQQGIAWEGIKRIYPPSLKNNTMVEGQIARLLGEYSKRQLRLEDVRARILELTAPYHQDPYWRGAVPQGQK